MTLLNYDDVDRKILCKVMNKISFMESISEINF